MKTGRLKFLDVNGTFARLHVSSFKTSLIYQGGLGKQDLFYSIRNTPRAEQ